MRTPIFAENEIAQAIYTWSQANVDGTMGVGFSVISSLLTGSIDWLRRLQPNGFKVTLDDHVSSAADTAALGEAKRGFSETGRLTHGDIGIIYCKTAEGSVDTKRRPADVVHAIMGRSSILDVSYLCQISDGFWTRTLDGPEGIPPRLPDLSLPDLVQCDSPDELHSPTACADGHVGAREFLHRLAEMSRDDAVRIDIPRGEILVRDVLLAIPAELHQFVEWNSYASVDGVISRCELRVPKGLTPPHSLASQRALHAQHACPLRQQVHSAAGRHLFCAQPRLADYARSAQLPPARQNASARTVADVGRRGVEATPAPPVTASIVVERFRAEISAPIRDLTNREGLQLAERLRGAGYDFANLPTEPTEMVNALLGVADDRGTLARWGRILTSVSTSILTDLWNRTEIAAFLGILLFRHLDNTDFENEFLLPIAEKHDKHLAKVLRLGAQLPNGGNNLAIMLAHGLGSTEASRRLLCYIFRDDPSFLFDVVLERAAPGTLTRLDYIRFGFSSWVAHRRIPQPEADAIYEMLRPGLMHRLRALLRRTP